MPCFAFGWSELQYVMSGYICAAMLVRLPQLQHVRLGWSTLNHLTRTV